MSTLEKFSSQDRTPDVKINGLTPVTLNGLAKGPKSGARLREEIVKGYTGKVISICDLQLLKGDKEDTAPSNFDNVLDLKSYNELITITEVEIRQFFSDFYPNLSGEDFDNAHMGVINFLGVTYATKKEGVGKIQEAYNSYLSTQSKSFKEEWSYTYMLAGMKEIKDDQDGEFPIHVLTFLNEVDIFNALKEEQIYDETEVFNFMKKWFKRIESDLRIQKERRKNIKLVK